MFFIVYCGPNQSQTGLPRMVAFQPQYSLSGHSSTAEFTGASDDTHKPLSPGSEPHILIHTHLSLSITQKENGKLAAIFSNSS